MDTITTSMLIDIAYGIEKLKIEFSSVIMAEQAKLSFANASQRMVFALGLTNNHDLLNAVSGNVRLARDHMVEVHDWFYKYIKPEVYGGSLDHFKVNITRCDTVIERILKLIEQGKQYA